MVTQQQQHSTRATIAMMMRVRLLSLFGGGGAATSGGNGGGGGGASAARSLSMVGGADGSAGDDALSDEPLSIMTVGRDDASDEGGWLCRPGMTKVGSEDESGTWLSIRSPFAIGQRV